MGGQHGNSVIPRMLLHPHKGKGWRRGGRRRGKSVRARGSSKSSSQRLPAASTPLPLTSIHTLCGAPGRHQAPLTFSRLKQLIWLMKANQSSAAALPCSRAGVTEQSSAALLQPGAPSAELLVLQRPEGPGWAVTAPAGGQGQHVWLGLAGAFGLCPIPPRRYCQALGAGRDTGNWYGCGGAGRTEGPWAGQRCSSRAGGKQGLCWDASQMAPKQGTR